MQWSPWLQYHSSECGCQHFKEYTSSLNMEVLCSSKMLIPIFQATCCHDPEDTTVKSSNLITASLHQYFKEYILLETGQIVESF
jgi:hypothetical protein